MSGTPSLLKSATTTEFGTFVDEEELSLPPQLASRNRADTSATRAAPTNDFTACTFLSAKKSAHERDLTAHVDGRHLKNSRRTVTHCERPRRIQSRYSRNRGEIMSRSRARWLPAIGALGLAAACQTTGFAADDARNTDEGRRAVEKAQEALQGKQQWIEGLALDSVTATEWSDSSLGCRRPGMQYMQAITSGYTVKFVGKDARREVHVAGDNAVVCTGFPRIAPMTGRPRVPIRKADAMIAAARADLTGKLGGTPESAKVVNWET